MTPSEKLMYDAIQEVEKLGADPKLTDIVVMLSKAKDLMSDWIDADFPHEVSQVKCDLCGKEWTAVRPEGLVKLECPECGNMVYFENI
jgi:hypothetical protein